MLRMCMLPKVACIQAAFDELGGTTNARPPVTIMQALLATTSKGEQLAFVSRVALTRPNSAASKSFILPYLALLDPFQRRDFCFWHGPFCALPGMHRCTLNNRATCAVI